MNGSLLHYTVTYISHNVSKTVKLNETNVTLTDLRANSAYLITVTATTGASGLGGGTSEPLISLQGKALMGKALLGKTLLGKYISR